MKKQKQGSSQLAPKPAAQLTLGEFAHEVVADQYRHLVKREQPVLADKDPEHLHQMRVYSRRLYTGLQVFEPVLEMPKAAQARRVRGLTRVLGKLRDLDVQLSLLQTEYYPLLSTGEQVYLEMGLQALRHKRRKALAGTRDTLTHSRYCDLKQAYDRWLSAPRFTRLGQLPVLTALPNLLAPLLSRLLLHPGWLLATDSVSEDTAPVLHDLRKACKHVRYQADFFLPLYGDRFKTWIGDLKQLQDQLGQLQDLQVLLELLAEVLPKGATLPQLRQLQQQQQAHLLQHWEQMRQPYLDRDFRYGLYQMLLEPL